MRKHTLTHEHLIKANEALLRAIASGASDTYATAAKEFGVGKNTFKYWIFQYRARVAKTGVKSRLVSDKWRRAPISVNGETVQAIEMDAEEFETRRMEGTLPGGDEGFEQDETPEDKPERPKKDPEEVAKVRAATLAAELQALVTSSRYPLINPEALVVKSHMTRSWQWRDEGYGWRESTPRTYVTDDLQVEPIPDARGRKFLFTGAQNDADVHAPFWKNWLAYAEDIDAEVVVGPGTYETQWWSENNPLARSYDPAITDYICYGRMAIGDNFNFVGNMNTLVTAKHGVGGLESHTQGKWTVYPHSTIQLKSIGSVEEGVQSPHMMSTGYCTRPQVIPRKAGIVSIFNHVIGGTIVEFDDEGRIFCRPINAADDGSFYDLDAFVSDGVVTRGHAVRAATLADVHRRKLSSRTSLGTFGYEPRTRQRIAVGSVLDELKPKTIFIHDVLDFEGKSHHRKDDPVHNYEMALRGRDDVEDEVAEVGQFLVDIQRPGMEIVVVESNHDIHLDRYVKDGNSHNDGINSLFGARMMVKLLENAKRTAAQKDAADDLARSIAIEEATTLEDVLRQIDGKDVKVDSFSLLEAALREMMGDAISHVKWVHDGKNFKIDDVECGQHGWRGKNGAHGTPSGLARLGTKMTIGDKHSPEILWGLFVAGVMQLLHGYNKGPSGWSVSHVIQYMNAKRTMITMQDGRWRAPYRATTAPRMPVRAPTKTAA